MLLASTCFAVPAAAAQDEEAYESLVAEGLSEFDAGRWVEAYNLFKKAHEISPNARTLRGMGMTSYELRDYPRALDQLRASLDSSARPLDAELQQHVQGLIERAARLVGTVDITLDPPDAELLVNDELVKDRTVLVPVGDVVLRARKQGYQSDKRVLTVDGGQRYPVKLSLVPIGASPPLAATAAPGPRATPATATDPAAPATTESDELDDGSVWSSPWLWSGLVAVVAGGVITAVVLSGDDGKSSEPFPDGNAGLQWQALGSK